MTVAPPLRAADPAPSLRGGRRLLAVAVLVAVVVALSVWLVAFSPVLGVRTVDVQGTRFLTAAQVRAAAGIHSGTPLVRLDTAAVVRRVEQLPAVRSARVHTHFPNGVTISITERTAVGFVEQDSRFVLVDGDGVQFRTMSVRPARLPQFALPGGAQAVPAARAVAGVAADLGAGLLAQVQSIQAFDPSAITLLLVDRRVVRWGSADRSADKARILPTLLAQPGTQYDVSNPDQVVAR